MALRTLIKNHRLITKTIVNQTLNYELIFVSNVRHISNSPQQTQMTKNYGKTKVQTINKTNLPKNMTLRHCSPTHSALLLNDMNGMIDSVPITTTVRRPLTLIYSWMLAKDKHLEKYRQLWFKRGFDVLTVRTSPIDLLLPPIGGRIVAQNLVKALSELSSQYNEIVIHAFSVGGYQYGETLVQLKEHKHMDVMNSIKGVIFDSCVFSQDCAPGLSRAITLNPMVQPIIESSISIFLKLFHNISVKNYHKAEYLMCNPLVKYPGLILHSKDDVVSSVESNEKMAESWMKSGNKVRSVCWDQSTHVLHYRDHQKEYEQELDIFIKSLKLRDCRI